MVRAAVVIGGLVGLSALARPYVEAKNKALITEQAIVQYGRQAVLGSELPVPGRNQGIVVHPDYLAGQSALGYTLLTDIDGDGMWDAAEKVHAGFTPGDYTKRLYYKPGFGPERDASATSVEIVGSEFFDLCQ